MKLQLLNAVLAKVSPIVVETHATTGRWPGGSAPYIITTTPTGGRRISVVSDEEDVIAGTGATIAEALLAVAKKAGVTVSTPAAAAPAQEAVHG